MGADRLWCASRSFGFGVDSLLSGWVRFPHASANEVLTQCVRTFFFHQDVQRRVPFDILPIMKSRNSCCFECLRYGEHITFRYAPFFILDSLLIVAQFPTIGILKPIVVVILSPTPLKRRQPSTSISSRSCSGTTWPTTPSYATIAVFPCQCRPPPLQQYFSADKHRLLLLGQHFLHTGGMLQSPHSSQHRDYCQQYP